jgi:dolichol-phosphate mannosyltransferase
MVTYHGGTSLRIFSTYGRGSRGKLIPNVVRAALEGKHISYAPGDLCHDFIYVDDICDAFLAAAEARVTGCYDAGTGVSTSLFEVAETAARLFDLKGVAMFGVYEPRSWDSVEWPAADAERTYRALGWRATVSLEAGMKKLASL